MALCPPVEGAGDARRAHGLDKEYPRRSSAPAGAAIDHVLWPLQVLDAQDETGWGFFATCFLMGGLQQRLRDDARARALELLGKVGAADLGVLAAAATYRVACSSRSVPFTQIRRYFIADENRDALLDSLSDGLIVESFCSASAEAPVLDHVGEIFRWLDIVFERLRQFQPRYLERSHDRRQACSRPIRPRAREFVRRKMPSTW